MDANAVPAAARRDRTLPDVVQGFVRSAGADEAQIPLAVVGGRLATDLVDLTDDLAALDSQGFWAVVLPFSGRPVCARFANVRPARPWPGPPWVGPLPDAWTSSLTAPEFMAGVESIRESIAAGDVYQVNLTRRLSAPLPGGADVAALGAALADGNPAPYSAVVRIPAVGCHIASASPERFLSRHGDIVESRPIKGTAPDPRGLTEKDRAENVMIVDLVRNDLGRVCDFGSVEVPDLLALEHHPGLVHLVSTVRGRLRPGRGLGGCHRRHVPTGLGHRRARSSPPSITSPLWSQCRGACTAGRSAGSTPIGSRGDLNVAIRTFWVEDEQLHLGTGGGITWGSDPLDEWEETELKARQLLRVASGSVHA